MRNSVPELSISSWKKLVWNSWPKIILIWSDVLSHFYVWIKKQTNRKNHKPKLSKQHSMACCIQWLKGVFCISNKKHNLILKNYLRNLVVLHWYLPWFTSDLSNSCLVAEEFICMHAFVHCELKHLCKLECQYIPC